MDKILIVGYGGHAKSILDAIESAGEYNIAGFVDKDMEHISTYRGYSVIGTDNDCQKLFESGIHKACMGIGFTGHGEVRERLYSKLKKIGFDFPPIIDPTSVIAKDAIIKEGTFIGKNVTINSDVMIGVLSIINTGAVIEHECIIGDYTHIAVNCTICGTVEIGNRCLIGANSTIIQGMKVCDETIVGAGTVLIKNVESSGIWVGVPGHQT